MNSDNLIQVVWGKTQAGTGDRHPLVCHMLDVGQVARALVASPAWKHVATRLGSRLGIDPLLAPSLCGFLASLHDLGKAAPAFQAKWSSGWQSVLDAGLLPDPNPPRDFHHGAETYASLPALLEDSGVLRVEDGNLHRLCDRLAQAVAAHHGTFLSGRVYAEVRPQGRDADGFETGWRRVRRALIERLASIFIGDFVPVTCRPANLSAAGVLLCGIVILADWIASNADRFPPAGECDLDEYVSVSSEHARRAIDSLGIVASPSIGSAPRFSDLFPAIKPTRPETAHRFRLRPTTGSTRTPSKRREDRRGCPSHRRIIELATALAPDHHREPLVLCRARTASLGRTRVGTRALSCGASVITEGVRDHKGEPGFACVGRDALGRSEAKAPGGSPMRDSPLLDMNLAPCFAPVLPYWLSHLTPSPDIGYRGARPA